MKMLILKLGKRQEVVNAEMGSIVHFLQKQNLIVTEKQIELLTYDLENVGKSENFGGIIYRTVANNSGNPTLVIMPFKREVYSVNYRKRLQTFKSKISNKYDEVNLLLSDNRITASRDKFFDRICGNGWMFGTHDIYKFDNNGNLLK